jgi:hypothetical protein
MIRPLSKTPKIKAYKNNHSASMYGPEMWSLPLKYEYKLQMRQNTTFRKIIAPKTKSSSLLV